MLMRWRYSVGGAQAKWSVPSGATPLPPLNKGGKVMLMRWPYSDGDTQAKWSVRSGTLPNKGGKSYADAMALFRRGWRRRSGQYPRGRPLPPLDKGEKLC